MQKSQPQWTATDVAIMCIWGTAILYAGYQVFWTLQPPGTFGPLWSNAAEVAFETTVLRRLYALEGWLIGSGLIIYLAIRKRT